MNLKILIAFLLTILVLLLEPAVTQSTNGAPTAAASTAGSTETESTTVEATTVNSDSTETAAATTVEATTAGSTETESTTVEATTLNSDSTETAAATTVEATTAGSTETESTTVEATTLNSDSTETAAATTVETTTASSTETKSTTVETTTVSFETETTTEASTTSPPTSFDEDVTTSTKNLLGINCMVQAVYNIEDRTPDLTYEIALCGSRAQRDAAKVLYQVRKLQIFTKKVDQINKKVCKNANYRERIDAAKTPSALCAKKIKKTMKKLNARVDLTYKEANKEFEETNNSCAKMTLLKFKSNLNNFSAAVKQCARLAAKGN